MYSTPRVALFDNHMDMATPSTAVRPLLDYRPACRILVIADTRRPVNQGFGARTTFMAWAADAALRLGAVLAVDDRFWSKGFAHGYHYGNSFTWAWGVLPFSNASAALRALPQGMTVNRKSLSVDELLRTAVQQRLPRAGWHCLGMR
jgi:hypothetical protein